MLSISAVARSALAACFLVAGAYGASANPNDTEVVKYKSSMAKYVQVWSDALKSLNGKKDRSKIDKASQEFSLNVKLINFPGNMDENDVKEVVSKMKTDLDKGAKAAFGGSTAATMTERHNLKKGAPRLLDVTVNVP